MNMSSCLVHEAKMTVLLQLKLRKSKPLLMLMSLFALTIVLADAQDQSGFISIDCGLSEVDYNDSRTGIIYTGDKDYIETGVNKKILSEYLTASSPRNQWTVRSFPQEQGNRHCYNLTAVQRKGKKFLIRATFMYGNYNGLNQTRIKFDLYLGVELWDTVTLEDSTSVVIKEMIHVPSSSYLYVCLVNNGTGTPFISALELRPINSAPYPTQYPEESLVNYVRLNFGAVDSKEVIRYPDDYCDRLWEPYAPGPGDSVVPLNTTLPIVVRNGYNPPALVMQTALTPRDRNASGIDIPFHQPDPNVAYYFYMHFAEVAALQSNQYRAFYVDINDLRWYADVEVPDYLVINTLYSSSGMYEVRFDFSLKMSENSTLQPIINAMEIYSVKRFSQSQTDENDVWAILNIKSTYGVKRSDWQGDPCLPNAFMWDGLDCMVSSDNTSFPPRITLLNLSSSGLTGALSSYFSNLIFLETLDLSNNSLTGPIPDFLADLPRLKCLNISLNQFSGTVPQKLLDKERNGLILRADNRNGSANNGSTADNAPGPANNGSQPCGANQCKIKKSNKFLIPLVVSLVALFMFAALVMTLQLRIRKIKTLNKLEKSSSKSEDPFLEKKNIQFTYSNLLKMTNNFQRVLGKGGFGAVYHGLTEDGKQVAVKLLSPSSTQGYHEFQIEAELLTRVHHRNLTYLVGYCYEGTHMALVYEYMAQGNLREKLSAKDGNVLSWFERLHIALDAAQGLDYLHKGCKPPIIHRDIKSSNILLSENLEAKLADFGLSRAFTILDGSSVSTKVVGTPGYLDPEYYEKQRLHEKSDIYSFGIVMLELITGMAVITGAGTKRHIVQWVSYLVATGDIASIVDPKLKGVYDVNSAWKALEVAMACVSPTSLKRPTMAQVLADLKACLVAEKVRSEGQDMNSTNDLLQVNYGVLEMEIGVR